jgi:hypothetical protein
VGQAEADAAVFGGNSEIIRELLDLLPRADEASLVESSLRGRKVSIARWLLQRRAIELSDSEWRHLFAAACDRDSVSCALIVLEFSPPTALRSIRPRSRVARLVLGGEVVAPDWVDDGVVKDDESTLFFEAGETLEDARSGRFPDSFRAMGGAVEQRRYTTRGPLILSLVDGLESVDLRTSGWTSVPDCAFAGYSKLASVAFSPGVSAIGDRAFSNCTSLVLCELPAGLLSIGEAAFYSCTSLGLVELPSGLASIGHDAFAYCTSLTMAELPAGLISLSARVFAGCRSLPLSRLPPGLTSVGELAFLACTSLVLTKLPAGLTSLAGRAFEGCTSLALRELPAGLMSVGSDAFRGCPCEAKRGTDGLWRIIG